MIISPIPPAPTAVPDSTKINEGIKQLLSQHVRQYFTGAVAEQVVNRAVIGLEKKVESFISSMSYEKLYRYAKPAKAANPDKAPRRKRRSKGQIAAESGVAAESSEKAA